jgi:hypothetical protein
MKFVKSALGLLLVTVGVSQAYVLNINNNGAVRHWVLTNPPPDVDPNSMNPATHAIRYYLASDAFSVSNATAELNALRASLGQWLAVSNTFIKFEEAGLIAPPVDVNTDDHTNIFYWVKDTTLVNGGNDSINGASGVAFTTFTVDDNIILEGDIVFNGFEKNWFTDFNNTSNTAVFVEGVALHEIGHLLGLAHSPVGGATMLFRGPGGVNLQAGLAADDACGGRFLYPSTITNVGAIRGTVTKDGSPIFGAAVFAETSISNVFAGTVTRSDGSYEINMLPAGSYQVRVAPLDSPFSGARLISGADIGSDFFDTDIDFLPTANTASVVVANTTNTVNFAATSGSPAFRISYIRSPTTSSGSYSISGSPISLRAGLSNRFIGVFSDNLPTSGATFLITGNGLTLGTPTYQPGNVFAGLNGISMSVSVSSNATPGLRDFIVIQGGNVAYANGFFEVLGTNTDYDFDGLEDTFQREYFPVFTSDAAGPGADPDGDGMINSVEFLAGTIPTNGASVLKMQSVARTNTTVTVRWDSVTGKKYQAAYRTNIASGSWVNFGSVVTAGGTTSSQTDTTATNAFRFYHVQLAP